MMEYTTREVYPDRGSMEEKLNLMSNQGWTYKAILPDRLSSQNLYVVVLFEREMVPVNSPIAFKSIWDQPVDYNDNN